MAQLSAPALCAVHTDTAATFLCDRCGSFGCAGCHAALERGELCRACAERSQREAVPWERWRELGIWSAFWQTVRRVCFSPDSFFEGAAHDRGVFQAMVFGTLAYFIPMLVHCLLYGVVLAVMIANVPGSTNSTAFGAAEAGVIAVILVISVIQVPFYAMMGMAIGSGLTHLSLKIFSAATASFEQTLRAVSYSNAGYAFGGIPCLGLPIGFIWMVAAEAIAIRRIHRCSTAMAVLSTVGYRILFWGAIGVFYAFMVAAAMRSARFPLH